MPDIPNGYDDQTERLRKLKKLQRLVMVGLIGAPVSLLLGGVALSIAALICAAVGMSGLKRMDAKSNPVGSMERTLYTQSLIALAVSIIALVLNAFVFANALTTVLEAYSSGNLEGLLSSIYSGQGVQQGSSSSSIWN